MPEPLHIQDVSAEEDGSYSAVVWALRTLWCGGSELHSPSELLQGFAFLPHEECRVATVQLCVGLFYERKPCSVLVFPRAGKVERGSALSSHLVIEVLLEMKEGLFIVR